MVFSFILCLQTGLQEDYSTRGFWAVVACLLWLPTAEDAPPHTGLKFSRFRFFLGLLRIFSLFGGRDFLLGGVVVGLLRASVGIVAFWCLYGPFWLRSVGWGTVLLCWPICGKSGPVWPCPHRFHVHALAVACLMCDPAPGPHSLHDAYCSAEGHP